MYVALNRVTNVIKLYLIGEYNANAIKVNQDATDVYFRLQEESKFDAAITVYINSHIPTVSLLSTRSLRRVPYILIVISLQYHCLAEDFYEGMLQVLANI